METLKKTREFQVLYKKGKNHVTHGFVCYYRENSLCLNRLGVVASKKIGNAVKRNRAKRVIREAFRQSSSRSCKSGYDFVFVARGRTPYMKSTEVYDLMLDVFGRIQAQKA
jgi:ribonuclease P protein component